MIHVLFRFPFSLPYGVSLRSLEELFAENIRIPEMGALHRTSGYRFRLEEARLLQKQNKL